MRLKEIIFVFVIFFFITAIFFHKTFLKGLVPIPGDLLVGNYEPYKSNSYFGYSPGGVPHKAQGQDVIRELFPWKFFSIEHLKNKEMPFWNPYNFSGNPHFANLQSGAFYIINLLFLTIPFLPAWSAYIILQPILAGFFTYLFLRVIKLGKSASLYGGITFAFSAFMVDWMQYGNFGHTFLWLPLVLFLIIKFLNKPDLLKTLFLVTILSLSILAGYIQLAIYIYIFSFCFILFHFFNDYNRIKNFKKYFSLFLSFLIPLFLTAFQTVPLIEFVQNSLRTQYPFSELSERLVPLQNIITIIFPDFFGNPATRNYWAGGTYIERSSYIGILSVLFIFFTFFIKNSKYKNFFLAFLLLSYLSILDIYPVKLFHSLGIPVLSTGLPTKALSIFSFSAAILSALGIDAFLKDENKNRYKKPFLILAGVSVLILISTFIIQNNNIHIARRNIILPFVILLGGGFIIFTSKFLPKKAIIAGFLILTIFDLFYFFQKITPFSPQEYVYPKTEVTEQLKKIQGINRYWGYGSAYIEGNFQMYEKNFSPEGYDALYIKRYGEFISASKNGKIPDVVPRTIANVAPGYGADDLRSNPYRQRALNLLGVKYVLHKKDIENNIPDYQTFDGKIYNMIWNKESWQIYENKEVLPRIFLSGNYIVESKNKEIIKDIYDSNFNLSEKIIIEESLPENFHPAKDENAKIDVKKYLANKIIIDTSSKTDTLLFMSDNYYPGWRAKIDGKDQKIYRADYTFRAIPVENGKHEVVLWYYPKSFDLGLKISLVTFLGLFGIVLLNKIKPIKYV